jgi:hypothetical protein
VEDPRWRNPTANRFHLVFSTDNKKKVYCTLMWPLQCELHVLLGHDARSRRISNFIKSIGRGQVAFEV